MYKKILLTLAITGWAAIGLFVYAAFFSGASKAEETSEKPTYAFTALGEQCAGAAKLYEQQAHDLNNEINLTEADMEATMARIQATINGNAASNTAAINRAQDGYRAVYEDGGMSREEYDSKRIQLNQTQSSYGLPSASAQIELNSIRAEWEEHERDGRQQVEDMKTNASKLKSCAESAHAQKNFTTTDTANFKTLINKVHQ